MVDLSRVCPASGCRSLVERAQRARRRSRGRHIGRRARIARSASDRDGLCHARRVELIRLSQPQTSALERAYVDRACRMVWQGRQYTERVTVFLIQDRPLRALLISSYGTLLLELSALLLDLGPGDEVICPSFSFPSPVTAVALRGARQSWSSGPHTLNIDAEQVAVRPPTGPVRCHRALRRCRGRIDVLLTCSGRAASSWSRTTPTGSVRSGRGSTGRIGLLATQSWHEPRTPGAARAAPCWSRPD